jgi:hypothetical protein
LPGRWSAFGGLHKFSTPRRATKKDALPIVEKDVDRWMKAHKTGQPAVFPGSCMHNNKDPRVFSGTVFLSLQP